MTRALPLAAVLVLAVLAACAARHPRSAWPPEPGFRAESSDPRALAVADRTMAAMGGYDAWQETRVLRWEFFGRRRHTWDKRRGLDRIESGERVVLVHVDSGEGRAWERGAEVNDPNALRKALQEARAWWVNDSYWLAMPFKLKDTGVALRYLGERPLPDGRPADVLELTFLAVGQTPGNKYHVHVSRDRDLVERWEYFERADDAEPKLVTPWTGWERHGRILLSGGRGERRITGIEVLDAPPPGFEEAPRP